MAENNLIRVRLVTPEKIFVDGTADSVSLPATSGYLEVLYAHAPLLAELGPGEVTLHGGDVGDQQLFVAEGFVEVLPDRVTILAESAIPPNEINVAEARQELEHGQKMWNEAGDEARRYDEANRVIREAEERIAAAERSGKSA
jgi:F-type H+-transporting ATPase subunit epsilon